MDQPNVSGTSGTYFTPSEHDDDTRTHDTDTLSSRYEHNTDNSGLSACHQDRRSVECEDRDTLSLSNISDTTSGGGTGVGNYSGSVADTNSTAIDIFAETNTTYDITPRVGQNQHHDSRDSRSGGATTPISEIIADLSKVKDEILHMSALRPHQVLTKDIATSVSDLPTDEERKDMATSISDIPTDLTDGTDEATDDSEVEEKPVEFDTEKVLDSDMIQLICTDEDKTIDTYDEKLHFMSVSDASRAQLSRQLTRDQNLTEDSINSKITESNFKEAAVERVRGPDSSRSPPPSSIIINSSEEESYNFNENSYSDGYFDGSLDKLYKEKYGIRPATGEEEEGEEEEEEEEEDLGCFHARRDIDQGKPFLFSRCGKKQLAIMSSITVMVMFAVAAAVVITVNTLFHSSRHHHPHKPPPPPPPPKAPEETYEHAAVASDSGICSKIGVDILRKNGSVVDAAIASGFCMSMDNMYSSGIGGGGFMLVYIRENKTFEALDFREVAPGRATSNMFEGSSESSLYGGKAIGVPGEVKGFQTAWKKYGVLPWKDLVQPTIDLARHGIPISPRLYDMITKHKSLIQEDSGLRKLLLGRAGRPLEHEMNITNEPLANTLEIIRDNPDEFYFGKLAEKIIKDITGIGGIISLDDLANYRVKKRDVISIYMSSLRLNTMGAPSGGPVVAQIINILKGYHLQREDIDNPDNERVALTYHRIIEAIKFAFAQGSKEIDPDFADKDEIDQLMFNMTDEKIGEAFRQNIDDERTREPEFYGGTEDVSRDKGTSHISIIGPNGDAVAMTTSINYPFGNMYRSPDTGIIYNNEMDDFSKQRSHYAEAFETLHNTVHGGKRPRSSMSPIIFTNKVGDVRFVIGGVGGSKIPSAVTEVLVNKFWFKDSIAHAVQRPRFHVKLETNKIRLEKEFPPTIKNLLLNWSHTVQDPDFYIETYVHPILVDDAGQIVPIADPRSKGSHAEGF